MTNKLFSLLSAGTWLLGATVAASASVIIVDENGHGTINGTQLSANFNGTDPTLPAHSVVLTYGPLGFGGTPGSVEVISGSTRIVSIRFNGDGAIRIFAAPNLGVNGNSQATQFQPPVLPSPLANSVQVASPGAVLSYTPTQPQPGYDPANSPTYIFLFSNTNSPANLVNPVGSDIEEAFQVNYASNLDLADSVINIVNSGQTADTTAPTGSNGSGNICANVYVYQSNSTLLACCSCNTAPNGLYSWPFVVGPGALLSKIAPAPLSSPLSVVVKVLATAPGGGGVCDPTFQFAPYTLVTGLSSRGTHSHRTPTGDVTLTETLYQPKALSYSEAQKLKADCTTIGGGAQCPACTLGGLAEPATP